MKKQPIKIIDSGAELSGDKTHRYSLWRTWNYDQPRIMFIGVNPSTADAVNSDKTITRCINFAAGWGFGSLFFANLYSFRTPDVYVKKERPDVEEQWEPLIENLDNACDINTDKYLEEMFKKSYWIVSCWGSWSFPGFTDRAKAVLEQIKTINKYPHCFGINADGQPKHPLYLKSSTQLQIYTA